MDIIKSNTIEYHDGTRRRIISASHLKHIRSRVMTHEGELLHGDKGKRYQDKYSKKYLGKDLSGMTEKGI